MAFLPNNIQNNFFQTPMSINDFEVQEVKGHGKFGSVSKVIYKKTGMIFALKIIKKNEETEIDFLREKQILYDLTKKNYKHVVKLYAHFEDYNNRYLVMEFVDGTTLKVLKGNPPNGYVAQELVINILMQLLEALVYLHDECHVIHRDIKPDNIILEKNGNIKLLDFGLSAYLSNPDPHLVSNRSLKGALHFAPEEIIFAPQPLNYDYKIDVFSLGFTIYSLMNPSGVGKKYNLPQITTGKYGQDLTRYDSNIINNFYSPWLIEFVEKLYENNQAKRPTAAFALKSLKEQLSKPNPNNNVKLKRMNSEINNVNVFINRNNINNQIYNKVQNNNISISQSIESNNNMNKINNPMAGVNFGGGSEVNTSKSEVEIFLNPNMGKENKIKSSMKCVLYILFKLDDMYLIRAQYQSIFNNCRTNYSQFVMFSFYQILNNLQQLEQGQIKLPSYDQAVNNFITHIFNNNNSGVSGARPMILFYMLTNCFRNEFQQNFKDIYPNKIYDLVIQNNYCFYNCLLPMNSPIIYKAVSDKILSFKDRFRGPFVDNFYFLLILLSKCPQCGSLFGISEFEIGQFLPLDVPNPENNISDLINNFFSPILLAGNNNCKNCGCQGKKLRQKYCLNLPKYLFLEFEERNKIFFNEKIAVPFFNGQFCYYQFCSCIYKSRINDTSTFNAVVKSGNGYCYYSNDQVNFLPATPINLENPSLAVYKLITS